MERTVGTQARSRNEAQSVAAGWGGGGGCQACEFTRITDMGNLQPILGDVVASLAPRQRGIHGGGALLKGGGG